MKKIISIKPLLLKGLSSLSLIAFFSVHAYAIEISSMVQVADEKGSATFTVKNTASHRLFLNVGMFDVAMVNGEIVKTPYTRENVKDWKIEVRPAKTIIDIGFEKDFKVSMKCGAQCDDSKDQVFMLAFVPTPYVGDNENTAHLVQMAIGFSPVFISAGKDQPLNYKVSYKGDAVTFVNNGDTYFNVVLDACAPKTPKLELKKCQKNLRVLAGRKLNYTLPENLQKPTLAVELTTNKKVYTENIQITKGN